MTSFSGSDLRATQVVPGLGSKGVFSDSGSEQAIPGFLVADLCREWRGLQVESTL